LNSYIIFCNRNRADVKKQVSESKDIVSELAKRWNNLDDELKKEYQLLATLDKKRYDDECEKYKADSENSD